MNRWVRRVCLAVALLGVIAPPAMAGLDPVPAGFEDEPVLEGLDSPMDVRFAADGRIFVAEKRGTVKAFDGPEDQSPETVVDIRADVHDYWDRGLLGIALDPEFTGGRPYLYLLYTRDAQIGGSSPRWNDGCGEADTGCPASARLVRVTVPKGAPAGPPTTLITDEWCQHYQSHSVGTVDFGPDGMLYIGAGESANFDHADWGQLPQGSPNPCGDPPNEGGMLRAQDVRSPADPTGLDGAIIRVDPDTGGPAPGNPFAVRPDDNAQRIVAYGLRNPFRFAFRPGTDEIWLGDVGWKTWEELNRITDANDSTAENFGWPCFEGAARQPEYIQPDDEGVYAPPPLCRSLSSAQVTPPFYAYRHEEPVPDADGCSLGDGASISGVAFAPAAFTGYEGALLFGDYASGCVIAMRAGANGVPDPSTVEVFARRAGAGGPVDLEPGPGGDVYYTLFDPNDPTNGAVRRIAYVRGNRAPVARIAADKTEGTGALDVNFSAAGSSDADGDSLTYEWDLDGDGGFDDATGMTASRRYEPPAQVRVAVRVLDGHGRQATASILISPGNTSPRPVIDAPAPGRQWSVGDRIEFSGRATDLENQPVALRWVVTLDHCIAGTGGCHAHPFFQHQGAWGSFVAPEHGYPTYLVLRLIATDSGGLTAETSIRLAQRAPFVLPAPPGPEPPGDRTPPPGEPLRLKLTGATKRKLGRQVSVMARCSPRCTLTARARLAVRGRSKALRAATRATGRIVVKLPAKARRRARAALLRRRVARVPVTVTARAATGEQVKRTRTIRLIRSR